MQIGIERVCDQLINPCVAHCQLTGKRITDGSDMACQCPQEISQKSNAYLPLYLLSIMISQRKARAPMIIWTTVIQDL